MWQQNWLHYIIRPRRDMHQEDIVITRDELYVQVWSRPMTILSKEYGISDVGLKKICNKLNVPVPGVGYWQKIKYGKQATKTPLPVLTEFKRNE